MLQEILRRIIDHTIPARLPQPWNFLKPVRSVRVLGGDPSALVATLLSEFPESELVNEQILLNRSADERQLTRAISATIPFKVLCREEDGAPCDFEHEQGRLTDGDPAAMRCLDDHLTRARSAKCKCVFAVFSSLDLAVLTLLGLPATPAFGLGRLTADQARRLFTPPTKSIDLPGPTDGSWQSPNEFPTIILVATELFTLRNQMPAGSLKVALQLQRVERLMKLDSAPLIRLWLPSTPNFRLIRDAVELADRRLIVNAIKNSLQSCESTSEYLASTLAPVDDDVPRARKKLTAGINSLTTSTFGVRDLPAQLEALRRAFDRGIIECANEAAMVAADPLDKVLWSAACELMEMQFEEMGLVQRTKAAIATGRAENVELSVEDRLHFQLRLADGLIRIKKAIAKNN